MRHVFGRKPSIAHVAGSAIALLTTLLIACGPASSAQRPAADDQARPQSGATKTLHVAMQSEPPAIVNYGFPTASLTPNTERWFIFHDGLTRWDFNGNPIPRIASKVPSIQDGDWKVNPDGSMDVTWKLRPDVTWHDGSPLTADDFVFGFTLALDKNLTVVPVGDLVKISEIRAVDPHTLAVHWRSTSIWGNANEREGFPSVPKHILNDLYQSKDYQAMDNSPLWSSEYIGLGPYKLKEIQQGSFWEAAAYDKYFLGKPKIDRLFLHWVPDVNVLNAQLLAGAIDLAPLGSMLKPEQILELRRGWVAEGKGEAYTYPNSMRTVVLNFRNPEQPWVKDVRFRRAMAHAMNRDSYVNDLQYGLTIYEDYYVHFSDPLLKVAEQRGVVKYPYDPARAAQLFAEAGWTRGADRMLHNAAGQTVNFRCCRLTSADSNDARESLAVNADLQAAGLNATYPLPSAPAGTSATDTRKFTAFEKEGNISPYFFSSREGFATLTSAEVAREENRWQGRNSGGWSNPTYDDMQTRAATLLDAGQRQEAQFQLLKMLAEEMPFIPMYYNPVGVAMRKGVEGVTEKSHTPFLALATSWNVETWDIR